MKHLVFKSSFFILSLIFAGSCQNSKEKPMSITPPIAKKNPTKLEKHGDVRVDDYYWMNDREDQEVLDYLNAENAYYGEMTSHTKTFQDSLFHEMKSRIKEDDTSVPYKYNGYWYITKFETGQEYPVYLRRKATMEAEDELMFDCNQMAKNHEFFNLRGISLSPDNRLASFATDTVSRRQYTIQVKDLESGKIYDDKVENTTGSSVWGNDGKTLFYAKKDPVTLRSDKIYRHTLGTSTDQDVLVFHEKDSTFTTFVYKTKSKKYLVIGSVSTLTSEYQILDANDPEGNFKVFSPRKRGLEYSISHYNGNFFCVDQQRFGY